MSGAARRRCTRCGKAPRRRNGYWCLGCHAASMRENRPSYGELTAEQKRRSNARSMANTYQRRGKLVGPKKCPKCGARKPEKHHEDYAKPLEVEWMCRPCHLELHREEAWLGDPAGFEKYQEPTL